MSVDTHQIHASEHRTTDKCLIEDVLIVSFKEL